MLTKSDLNKIKGTVKEVVVEAFEPFAKAIQTDFGVVNKRLGSIEGELREVKSDVSTLKSDVREVKSDVSVLKGDMQEVKSDVKWMKENSSELFTKIDRFISLYEDQKKELAAFGMQLKRLEDRVVKLERKR